jgi:hypothetical protein
MASIGPILKKLFNLRLIFFVFCVVKKNFYASRNVSTLSNEHGVIKTVLFNHEITNTFDVGALITLQILTLFSYLNMSKIDTVKRTNTLLPMLTQVVVLCYMTSCSLVDFQERFGLEYRLHWQERQKRNNLQKCWCSHIRAYWVTKHKTTRQN